MKISHFIEENILLIEITEELDQHSTDNLRKRIDYDIGRLAPSKLVIDFKNVFFMDSAGIGFLIGRYKKIKMYGGNLEIINASEKINKIFEMAGIPKIIKINKDIENNYFEKI